MFKRCKFCCNRFVPKFYKGDFSVNTEFCSELCGIRYDEAQREKHARFRKESEPKQGRINYFCSLCGGVFSSLSAIREHVGRKHLKFEQPEAEKVATNFSPNKTVINSPKLKAVVQLILRGATEGERVAAKAAYKRITGTEYI